MARRMVCLKSKAAILILIWTFSMAILQGITFSNTYSLIYILGFLVNTNFVIIVGCVYIFYAILQLFYPLAGLLADVRFGRYRSVICSLWSLLAGFVLILMSFLLSFSKFYLPLGTLPWSYAVLAIMLAMLAVPIIIGIFLYVSSIVTFNANFIQFGLDQLHDAPTEHLVIFIHWCVLVSNIGMLVTDVSVDLSSTASCQSYFLPLSLTYSLCLFAFVLLFVSLCVGYCKRRVWFLTDSASRNPYKLVYKVINFTRKHKIPIRRSAFTYCEDELPSRMDFGKEKYGGPFTTEQVENVKVFFGILKVLLSLGPVFAVERSTTTVLPLFSKHLSRYSSSCASFLLSSGTAPYLLVVILLSAYIILLRSYVIDYIPGIFKRIGLGMMLLVIPIACCLILDSVGHTKVLYSFGNEGSSNHSSECVLTMPYISINGSDNDPLDINPLFLAIPFFFQAAGSMIFYIAVFEFIFSQSPHSMKGLLIGTLFAIRGIFQLLGALMFMFPFLGWKLSSFFPSCGFVYYLINLFVCLVGVLAYMWTARRFKRRQRDEPDNIYRYAEEYYSKIKD